MKKESITALVSAFSRSCHSSYNKVRIFDDYLAKDILSKEEIERMSAHMSQGIHFFNSEFCGTSEEALRWIVDHQLSPSPLGRAAFAEKALKTATVLGSCQYIILGAGYDSFAYRQPEWASHLKIFEVDSLAMILDKERRISKMMGKMPENLAYCPMDFEKESLCEVLSSYPQFDSRQVNFFSLLGITYYLSQSSFVKVIEDISKISPQGSSIVLDYPDELTFTDKAGDRVKKQVAMAGQAGENMVGGYAYDTMEDILATNGFLVYEHLTPEEITQQYFSEYNLANPRHMMTAFDNVNYCLAVKKQP